MPGILQEELFAIFDDFGSPFFTQFGNGRQCRRISGVGIQTILNLIGARGVLRRRIAHHRRLSKGFNRQKHQKNQAEDKD